MTQEQIVSSLVSIPFIAACTQLLRKFFPSLEGNRTYFVLFGLAAVASLLTVFSAGIPDSVWQIIATIYTVIIATGANSWVNAKTERLGEAIAANTAIDVAPQIELQSEKVDDL